MNNSEKVEHPTLKKEKVDTEKHGPLNEGEAEPDTTPIKRYVSDGASPTPTEPNRDAAARTPTAVSPPKLQQGPVSVSRSITSPVPQTSNLELPPPTIFPHTLETPPLSKMVDYNVPHITHTFSDLRHPNNIARPPTPDLFHMVTDHHHVPHLQHALHSNQKHLSTEPTPSQSAPLPPPTPSPMPPLHIPGPGVTVGRMVMTASPPTVPPVPPSLQQQRVTGFTIHCQHHPDPPPSHLHTTSLESHPSGYTQNPNAPYPQGRRNDDEGKNGEDIISAFLRIGTPTGATVSTKGYHRRGEDVGLVASLMSLWEKGVDWLPEWMQMTRR